MLRTLILSIILCVAAPTMFGTAARAGASATASLDGAAHGAISSNARERREAVQWLLQNGGKDSVSVLIQLLRWLPDEERAVVARLEALTGAEAGSRWFDWMIWQQSHPEYAPYPGYIGFLADLLAGIDPQCRRFVRPGGAREMGAEEIAWGGVAVDGIPALDNPTMVAAAAATYLNPDDAVFGVEINGEARAYPLRIVNWHEMVNDVVGGVPVSLAYCTLCGAGILFDGRVAGHDRPFTFGSSGLLYRSNKLMYDRQTDSLWNQFTGRPVMGPLTWPWRPASRGTIAPELPIATISPALSSCFPPW